jgi:hypothetical protein
MRRLMLTGALLLLAVVQAGCAAGFRAGGPNGGVGVGAAVGPPASPSYYGYSEPPPPWQR